MAIWRNIWSCVVRFSRMPGFPATGYLGFFLEASQGYVLLTCVAYPSSQRNNQRLRLVQFNGLFNNPRTSPHTSTKCREGINPRENPLKPQLISITITYNTSSLARPIKLRLTTPNWECPSPDYGSHIIFVHHWHIFSYINPHTISFTSPIFKSAARDNICHNSNNTLVLVKYTSAPFSSLALTDYFLTAGSSLPWSVYRGPWSVASGRRTNCTQSLGSGLPPVCPTSSPVASPAH